MLAYEILPTAVNEYIKENFWICLKIRFYNPELLKIYAEKKLS